MKASEIKEKVLAIKTLASENKNEEAQESWDQLADELFEEKNLKAIADLYEDKLFKELSANCFNMAYALVNQNKEAAAEIIYSNILEFEPDNPAVLNNLSNLLAKKKKYQDAYNLILKAYEINPKDEAISNNYNSLTATITEINEKEQKFNAAKDSVIKENEFVRSKLLTFIKNSKKDPEFDGKCLPIPNWKFRVLMATDEAKSDSLKKQWISKGYLFKTDRKKEGFVSYYELNPLIEQSLADFQPKAINKNWLSAIELMSIDNLERINYFDFIKKLDSVKKKFKSILLRDFDELISAYLIKNFKTVIILSGSIIETLLIYQCERKKIDKVAYTINNRTVSKDLYDCDLGDLLKFFEERNYFSKQLVHLGNVSRIYRNFIHPGKEIREEDELDGNKAELCFLALKEIINGLV